MKLKNYTFTFDTKDTQPETGYNILHATNKIMAKRADNFQSFNIEKITDEQGNVYKVDNYTSFYKII